MVTGRPFNAEKPLSMSQCIENLQHFEIRFDGKSTQNIDIWHL
jgi:hypothetical protein